MWLKTAGTPNFAYFAPLTNQQINDLNDSRILDFSCNLGFGERQFLSSVIRGIEIKVRRFFHHLAYARLEILKLTQTAVSSTDFSE